MPDEGSVVAPADSVSTAEALLEPACSAVAPGTGRQADSCPADPAAAVSSVNRLQSAAKSVPTPWHRAHTASTWPSTVSRSVTRTPDGSPTWAQDAPPSSVTHSCGAEREALVLVEEAQLADPASAVRRPGWRRGHAEPVLPVVVGPGQRRAGGLAGARPGRLALADHRAEPAADERDRGGLEVARHRGPGPGLAERRRGDRLRQTGRRMRDGGGRGALRLRRSRGRPGSRRRGRGRRAACG